MNTNTNTNTEFIYAPRSGDRVIAESFPALGVAQVGHENGCRHVFGGAVLRYQTASSRPSAYWRVEACAVAASLVAATGGIAWDDCGEVCLVVPIHLACEVDEAMRAARPLSAAGDVLDIEYADARNQAAMVAVGAMAYAIDRGQALDGCRLVARRAPSTPEPMWRVVEAWAEEADGRRGWDVVTSSDGGGDVVAHLAPPRWRKVSDETEA